MLRSLPPAVLMTAGVALAAGIFFAAVFLPGRARAETLNREITAARADLARLPAARAAAERLRAELAAATADHAGADGGRFVDAGSPHAAFAAITVAAEAAGVHVTRLVPAPAVVRRSYEEWPFRLEFDATYADLARFLARLEAGGTLGTVTALLLTPRDGDAPASADGGDTVLRGELSLVVYARAETGGGDAQDAPSP